VGQVLARTAKGAGLSGDSSPPTPLSVKSSLILGEIKTNCKRNLAVVQFGKLDHFSISV
jgi:hypothetical protein